MPSAALKRMRSRAAGSPEYKQDPRWRASIAALKAAELIV